MEKGVVQVILVFLLAGRSVGVEWKVRPNSGFDYADITADVIKNKSANIASFNEAIQFCQNLDRGSNTRLVSLVDFRLFEYLKMTFAPTDSDQFELFIGATKLTNKPYWEWSGDTRDVNWETDVNTVLEPNRVSFEQCAYANSSNNWIFENIQTSCTALGSLTKRRVICQKMRSNGELTCSDLPCRNRAKCVKPHTGSAPSAPRFICVCPAGKTGVWCEEDEVDPCRGNPCGEGGQCVRVSRTELPHYACNCKSDFTGIHCESKIDHCATSPCLNNATCQSCEEPYYCTCLETYTGTNCETHSIGPSGSTDEECYSLGWMVTCIVLIAGLLFFGMVAAALIAVAYCKEKQRLQNERPRQTDAQANEQVPLSQEENRD